MTSRTYLTREQIQAHKEHRATLPVHPALANATGLTRPANLSLASKCPFVYDQGDIGSCTANAICMALVMLETEKTFLPSRLYLYYKERLVELQKGQKITDSGAYASDGLAVLTKMGVCPESDWPYLTSKVDTAPPANCDTDAKAHLVHQVGTVAADKTAPEALITAIANSIELGIPVLIAIEVYASFESNSVAQTGEVPIPKPHEAYLGGHEVLIVGYNDTTQKFHCINSWGTGWGQKGFFDLPYGYVTNPNLTSEFICITKV